MRHLKFTALVLLICGLVAWYIISHNQKAKSERLVHDTVQIIREVANIEREATKEGFEGAYQFQQLVTDAQHRLQPWLSEHDPQRRRIIEAARDMLSDLDEASKLYLTIQKGSNEEQLARFKVKLESGRKKTIDVTTTILKQEGLLTSAGKRRIIDYINLAFGKELANYQATKDDPKAPLTYEVAAVLVMKKEYEKHP
jgi:hypothetical protein